MTPAEIRGHPLAPRLFDDRQLGMLSLLERGEMDLSDAARMRLAQMEQQIASAERGPTDEDELEIDWDELLNDGEEPALAPAPSSFIDDAGLELLPSVEWDMHEMIPAGGFTYLLGETGVGKTLTAIQLAAHISLGLPWCGRAVRKGRVRYVAAEGARSLNLRVAAWKHHVKGQLGHEVKSTGVLWYPRRLHLVDPAAVAAFVNECERDKEPTSTIFVDTWGKCTQGIRENDPDGTGQCLEQLDLIRDRLGCSIVTLAHPARTGLPVPRGHSSQEGAADSILFLADQGDRIQLDVAKNRDGPEGLVGNFYLASQPVAGTPRREEKTEGNVPCQFPLVMSRVLVPLVSSVSPGTMTDKQRAILRAIRDTDRGTGVSVEVISETAKCARGYVYRVLKKFSDEHLVTEKNSRFSLTPGGLALC